jgi:two-component sensor histidine kinase
MRILHLEDNEGDAALICEKLRRDGIACDVTRVETRGEFLQALDDPGDWDVILADYSLPSFDGVSALALAVEKRPDIPFIFVTGSLGEERAVSTLKNGATDYILKRHLDRLPQAVVRARRESEVAQAKKEADRHLEASLREKEVLLQEVHHRVNNNLQIICSLFSLQSGESDDPVLTSVLGESQRRVQSMAMIHAMLYASTSLKDIDFAEYTHLLAALVSNAYHADSTLIQLVFDLEPLRFEIDRAIPCGLILNELLSNAFKYAFPNGGNGEIRVSLRRRGHCIRLAVEDTGVGLPGIQPHGKTKSLGLTIVEILSKQLGGSIEISSDKGAHFVLTLNAPSA